MSESESNLNVPRWLMLFAAVSCIIAIGDLPYGFYRLLRWIACGVAIASGFHFYSSKQFTMVWIAGIIALIFNPLFPFFFSKDVWRVLDAGAGISFIIFFVAARKIKTDG